MTDIQRLSEGLIERGLTVAVAESATSGLTGYLLSSLPGSSTYFLGGVIAYANQAKQSILHVPESAFARGVVSPDVAEAMARSVRELLNTDIGIADTGIAGPGGATETKPVGLFYIALSAHDEYEVVHEYHFDGNREGNRKAAADAMLALVQEYLDTLQYRSPKH
jgi:PncC family amidohydrolase